MTRKLDAALGLFIFRIVVGFLFAVHGTVKLFGWPAGAGSAAAVAAWPSWWAGLIELVTGLLVMSGLFTRAAAFLASGTMAVAYFWKHQPDGLMPIHNNGESAALYSFAFLLLVFTGAGAWAIDNVRRRASAPIDRADTLSLGRRTAV
ncbi:DoxX family protein [Mycobacterium sp. smrl_JER01]|uniref:DoxX family protein n=1 Tax=Mycobacterium sp. smrl_JER01 TaxID=3402633 RepID=UPI003AC43559